MPTKLLSGTPNLLNQESVVESTGDSELEIESVSTTFLVTPADPSHNGAAIALDEFAP